MKVRSRFVASLLFRAVGGFRRAPRDGQSRVALPRSAGAARAAAAGAGVASLAAREKAQRASVDQFKVLYQFQFQDRVAGERNHVRAPDRRRCRHALQGRPLRSRHRDRRRGRRRRWAARTSISSTSSAATSCGRTSAAASSETSPARRASRSRTGSASPRRSPTSTTTATRTCS